MVVSPGVHVSGISKNITQNQLESLFSKIHPVREVYIPTLNTPTGLYRNFAVVRFLFESPTEEVNDAIFEVLNKCVKSFNGSLWQGSKIKVAIAKTEYWAILRGKERHENVATSKEADIDSYQATNLLSKESTGANCREMPPVLSIRKRSTLVPIKVSTKPYFSSSNLNSEAEDISNLDSSMLTTLTLPTSQKEAPLFRGRRTIFVDSVDDTAVIEHYQNMSTSINVAQQLALKEKKNKEIEDAQKLLPASIGKRKGDSAIPKRDGEEKAAAAAQPKKPEGGGRRKGFGTLIHTEEEGVDAKEKNRSSQVLVDQSTAASTTDNMKYTHIDEYIDAEPCIPPSELQDQFLMQEKERALSLLDMVLKKNSESSSSSNNTNTNTTINTTTTTNIKNKQTAPVPKVMGDQELVIQPTNTAISSQPPQPQPQPPQEQGHRVVEHPDPVAPQSKPSNDSWNSGIHLDHPTDVDHFADLGTLKNIFFKEVFYFHTYIHTYIGPEVTIILLSCTLPYAITGRSVVERLQ